MLCEWTNTLLATALLAAVTIKSQDKKVPGVILALALVQLDF